MNRMEKAIEGLLWNSRLIVIVAVVSSLAAGIAMFFLASVDTWYLISHLGDYVSSTLSPAGRGELRASLITHVVEIIDGFLLATVLLIFALGLYELFISKIDAAETSENANNVLMINSLDDLKTRLAKVVLMILIVKFFEHALSMKFLTSLDMLYFAGGIALIGLALYLSHSSDSHGS
jgi:uncharacterized membrane protein YqhA